MFPSIHDAVIAAVRARDHAVCFILKNSYKTRGVINICFEGKEEEIEDLVEDPF